MLVSKQFEVSTRVQLCADSLQIGGQILKSDATKSYVEFRLSHGFPVTTSDLTCLHPNTVRNSYQSMLHQVFNLGHIMRAYNPEEHARDRILGSIVGVEFTGPHAGSSTRIGVQSDRAKAPGIRAVAVMHKQAERVDKILGEHKTGRRRWTVSMENVFRMDASGFLVRDEKQELSGEFETPEDFRELGWTYIPCLNAPDKLAECFDEDRVRIKSKWGRRDVRLLVGGLDGRIHYQGVGLTPLGKEPEAEVTSMMASGWGGAQIIDALETPLLPGEEDVTAPLLSFTQALSEELSNSEDGVTAGEIVSPLEQLVAGLDAAVK